MNNKEQLELLATEAKICTSCELYKNRIKSVFQRGNPDSEIVFIGEAGGKNENIQGIPFCGRSGKLLDNMIKAMGFDVEDVYITNICNCSPPDNRKPTPQEMKTCLPFLVKQLDIIQPKVIITLGATAMEGILGGTGITKRRGKWEQYNGIPVMVLWHPAYILRNPNLKEETRQDLRQVLVRLGKVEE